MADVGRANGDARGDVAQVQATPMLLLAGECLGGLGVTGVELLDSPLDVVHGG